MTRSPLTETSRDWEGYFAEQRREAQHRAQVARDYWAQTDEERREGFMRLHLVSEYNAIDDAIETHYLREPDPRMQAEDDLAYYQSKDAREL